MSKFKSVLDAIRIWRLSRKTDLLIFTNTTVIGLFRASSASTIARPADSGIIFPGRKFEVDLANPRIMKLEGEIKQSVFYPPC